MAEELHNQDTWDIVILHTESQTELAANIRDSIRSITLENNRQIRVEIFDDLHRFGTQQTSTLDDIFEHATFVMFIRNEEFFTDRVHGFGVGAALEDRLEHENPNRQSTLIPINVTKKTKIKGKHTINGPRGLTVSSNGDIERKEKERLRKELLRNMSTAPPSGPSNTTESREDSIVAGQVRQAQEISRLFSDPLDNDNRSNYEVRGNVADNPASTEISPSSSASFPIDRPKISGNDDNSQRQMSLATQGIGSLPAVASLSSHAGSRHNASSLAYGNDFRSMPNTSERLFGPERRAVNTNERGIVYTRERGAGNAGEHEAGSSAEHASKQGEVAAAASGHSHDTTATSAASIFSDILTFPTTASAISTNPMPAPALSTTLVDAPALSTSPMPATALSTTLVDAPALSANPLSATALSTSPIPATAYLTNSMAALALSTNPMTVPALSTNIMTVPAISTNLNMTVPGLSTNMTVPALSTSPMTVPALSTNMTAPDLSTSPMTTPALSTSPMTTPALSTSLMTAPALSNTLVPVPALSTNHTSSALSSADPPHSENMTVVPPRLPNNPASRRPIATGSAGSRGQMPETTPALPHTSEYDAVGAGSDSQRRVTQNNEGTEHEEETDLTPSVVADNEFLRSQLVNSQYGVTHPITGDRHLDPSRSRQKEHASSDSQEAQQTANRHYWNQKGARPKTRSHAWNLGLPPRQVDMSHDTGMAVCEGQNYTHNIQTPREQSSAVTPRQGTIGPRAQEGITESLESEWLGTRGPDVHEEISESLNADCLETRRSGAQEAQTEKLAPELAHFMECFNEPLSLSSMHPPDDSTGMDIHINPTRDRPSDLEHDGPIAQTHNSDSQHGTGSLSAPPRSACPREQQRDARYLSQQHHQFQGPAHLASHSQGEGLAHDAGGERAVHAGSAVQRGAALSDLHTDLVAGPPSRSSQDNDSGRGTS